MVWKIVAGILGGFLVAFFVGNLSNLAFSSKGFTAIAFLVSWLLTIGLSIKAVSATKVWRYSLLLSGAMSFLVPLASLIHTVNEKEGTEAIGGLIATGVVGFVFFFVGLAFIIIGLLVGRSKHVVVIDKE